MNRITNAFRRGQLSDKLIFINVGIFLSERLLNVLLQLFNKSTVGILSFLQVSSTPEGLLKQPWSIITYSFLHADFLHILFNMLWLYWFGRMFLYYFTNKQLVGVYLLGAIAGALIFILAYNTFPYFEGKTNLLIGASAAVMAIVFAVAAYNPNLEIRLLLLGRIKLIYLAGFVFLLDFLSITTGNAGGHFAHIGGALFGILFAAQYRKGRDLSNIINKPIDWLVGIFPKKGKQKSNMKVTYQKPNIDWKYNDRKNKKNAEIDAILEKIKRSGYESLTKEEKQKLFDAGNK